MAVIQFNCSRCAQSLEALAEAAGRVVVCPSCQAELRVPAAMAMPVGAGGSSDLPAPPTTASRPTVCAICLSPISEEEGKNDCPDCRAEYHTDCWRENGGCAVYGCSQVPAVEQRQAIEIPPSYWGQENKPCPACGQEILAAAKRCRHCGATFGSARPEDANEFRQRGELEQRLPATRRAVIWLFVLCALPGLAPIGAVWGAVWYLSHREEVKALPSLYPALCKVGLGVAIGQTVLMAIMGLLFAAFRSC